MKQSQYLSLTFLNSWEPSVAQGHHVTPPFTRTWTILPGNKIFAIKVDTLNLESQLRTSPASLRIPQ